MSIPVKYLVEEVDRHLMEYQLARLGEFTTLKRAAERAAAQAIERGVEVAFAVWLREHKEELIEAFTSLAVEKTDENREEV